MKVGFDFGSKNIHYAVLKNDSLVLSGSGEHNGDIIGTLDRILSDINKEDGAGSDAVFGVTGTLDTSAVSVIDSVVAAVEANRFLQTGCRNIISIGCESFSLIRLDENYNYLEHVVNSDCASGTGSFVDQQAKRLGFESGVLADKAAGFSGSEPSIATRCAVFAKSDIIHAQAQGFSPEAIAAGLCSGVTRSVLSNVLKGRKLPGKSIFAGGMSRNRKIVNELENALEGAVEVIEESPFLGAIGAALLGKDPLTDFANLTDKEGKHRATRPDLSIDLPDYPDFDMDETREINGVEVTCYKTPDSTCKSIYIGIDVGSTSTKSVVTTMDGTIIAGFYARTQGDPVDAVTRLLQQIKELFKAVDPVIKGVATTGSGRELIKELTRADLAVNEITAHAKGSYFLDPDVDTIIEIGGQDSKFTLLEQGVVTHATMNYVCAAGTGSFIEEQAKRLDMPLSEISGAVTGKSAPYTSDRCTVYMERDLNIFLAEGWDRTEIMAAVLYSVRDNYLSKVVGKSTPGSKIAFQGATARNKALVAVFQNELEKPVHVSKYCHLTGAIGCAVSLMEQKTDSDTFTGVDFSCTADSEICDGCTNRCDLRIYTVDGKKTAWGLKCGRDYNDRTAKTKKSDSVLETDFHSRFSVPVAEKNTEPALTIGIPRTLFMMEYLPMFQDFFQQLGLRVVIEKSSGKKLNKGMSMINADFCAPMALAHGMVASLAEKNVDYIFMPTLINEQNYLSTLEEEELFQDKITDGYFCYYSSYTGTILSHLPGYDFQEKILHPKIRFNNTSDETVAEMLADSLAPHLNIEKAKIAVAFTRARTAFREKTKDWIDYGQKKLTADPDKPQILLLGRPYALFDKRVNLGIPARLESMGFDLISQSMIASETFCKANSDMPDYLDNMHWYFGQQVLIALEALRENRNLYPVLLTCFRCSPDAYLMNYFKEFMDKIKRPYLILQLDEHSSDVGYMTRIEAAVDTFQSDFSAGRDLKLPIDITRNDHRPDELQKGDTVLIPETEERINRLHQAVFEAAGFNAQVAVLDTEILNNGYRYVSGGECLPNVAITGSLISTIKNQNLDPETTILHLPNLCLSCNFNQYANLIRLACQNAGLGRVRIMNANGLKAVPGLPPRSNAFLLSVTILSSVLNKLRFRFEPYETTKGVTAKAVAESEEIIRWHILNRKSLMKAAGKIREIFDTLPLPDKRKPRIGILGDMYAKYNTVLNDAICDYAQELGGEILLPSYNELMLHTAHADVVEHQADEKLWKTMVNYEAGFEEIFEGILDDQFEPPLDECQQLMEEFGFTEFITGETTVSLGRMLYYAKHNLVDAVLHVNPVFCCPGVISTALFRKIQSVFQLPVIDLFYDGTNKPNKMIDPHLYYLVNKAG